MELNVKSNEDLMNLYGHEHNSKAFDELYKRYHRRMYGYFFSKVKGEEAAHDLTQEFFDKIHTNRDKYKPTWKLDAWFFTIARNLFISHYRYNKLRDHMPFDENRNCESCEYKDVCTSELNKAIDTLPPIYKKALTMRYFKDCPYEEISKEINKTPVNTRKIVSRAITQLKTVFAH